MRKTVIIAILLLIGFCADAQEILDLESNKKCELFSSKDNFNKQDRLEKIKSLGGQSVTVYLIKGKNNKIKSKYTGTIDLVLVNKPNPNIDLVTSVLTITMDNGNGQMMAKFPHTDKKEYRIYLAECLNK